MAYEDRRRDGLGVFQVEKTHDGYTVAKEAVPFR
jgi:hypothetical protein